jgi:hypothetical protein
MSTAERKLFRRLRLNAEKQATIQTEAELQLLAKLIAQQARRRRAEIVRDAWDRHWRKPMEAR